LSELDRDDGGDVTHAGYEIAEREQPAAESAKPCLRSIDRVLVTLKPGVQDGGIDNSSHDITETDSAETSGNGGGRDRRAAQETLSDERAGDGQQELVGNRQAEDAEYLREEQERRAVANEPGDELAFEHRNYLAPAAPRWCLRSAVFRNVEKQLERPMPPSCPLHRLCR
jgi:hypothetical protein